MVLCVLLPLPEHPASSLCLPAGPSGTTSSPEPRSALAPEPRGLTTREEEG